MAISSTTRKAGPYSGNNVTTAFPFSFKVFNAADVLVVKTDPAAAESTLALTTDYTVSLNANQDTNPGGTVTLNSALLTNYLLTITSQVAATQGDTFTNNGGWYPAVVNDALDRLTILAQQLQVDTARSVKVPLSSSTNPDTLVASVVASAASASASAAAAASSATAAANAIPAGSLGYTPVNKAGDTMTGNLALPGINVNGSGVLTALGNAATKTTGAATGNVPLWDYLPLNSRNPQGAAYSVVTGDRGKLIDATTGTWALTMNPATLGANFAFAVRNSGTGVITLTPSSGTVNGAATAAMNPGESCLVFCDGTNFETVGMGRFHFSMVQVNTTNGFGSTNTQVRRWTNVAVNQGTDITYADSATLGGTFTVNTAGMYAITYTDQFNAASAGSITNNNTTYAPGGSAGLAMMNTTGAGWAQSCSWVGYLTAGSVIRATAPAPSGANVSLSNFTVARVG